MFGLMLMATTFVTANSLFLFYNDHQCNVNIQGNSSRNVSLNVAETVPAFCGNGTFHWSLPNGSANVTFLNYFLLRSVCITHSVFKVQEVTYGRGTLLNTKGKYLCSRSTTGNITLHVDSSEQKEFAGVFHYMIERVIM